MACADIFASNNSTECNANLLRYDKKERMTQLSKLFFNRVHPSCMPSQASCFHGRAVLRTAAHTARLSNVITVWTSVVLHEFYKMSCSQITSYVRSCFWAPYCILDLGCLQSETIESGIRLFTDFLKCTSGFQTAMFTFPAAIRQKFICDK